MDVFIRMRKYWLELGIQRSVFVCLSTWRACLCEWDSTAWILIYRVLFLCVCLLIMVNVLVWMRQYWLDLNIQGSVFVCLFGNVVSVLVWMRQYCLDLCIQHSVFECSFLKLVSVLLRQYWMDLCSQGSLCVLVS